MPFARPTLSDLRAQVAGDITAGLSTDGLLRFSNMNVTGTALAGMAHLHYGYLDWIARQGVPFTASAEFLEAWAALKKIYRKIATSATGQVTFQATAGVVIDAGTEVIRSDSVAFTVDDSVTVDATGVAVVTVTAVTAGEAGNTPLASIMTLGASITGVQSSGKVTGVITGGADQELDESLFERMLAAYQNTPNGGASADYVTWALEVSGVTRAWCAPNGFGTGTVVIYTMFDDANSANQGFPQGTDGVSENDNRATSANLATGDQLTVANSVFGEQPVTAMVYCCAPIPTSVAFTITGLTNASTSTREAIAAAISEVFTEQGAPLDDDSFVALSDIDSAIAAVASTSGFVITSPVANLTNTLGHLPTLGTITYE
ncbi:baseplate J/gp47 family protein [Pseudomonas bohemica]|uniref:baseplate J/gp47 family protein n=1 Tax=Pseudomonas bohemica TaxID=2044872 RepID=UPI000DA60326|nr:baseplate J/gp47 family protein [Pseudomonas bohemica]